MHFYEENLRDKWRLFGPRIQKNPGFIERRRI